MKKNIYTGIFCTILGLCINTPANASIISRSFLDEALTDYATTTALDLKANQSDFRELNTQISDSVDLLRELLIGGTTSYEFVNNINPEKFPNTISGAFGLLYQYLDGFAGSILYGWTDSNGTSYAGFRDLNNGWTDSEKKTYLGVKGLNDKIGWLPSAMAFYEYDTNGTLGYNKYPTSEVFGINDNIGGMLTAILQGFGDSSGHRVLSLPEISTRTLRLSDQIGTLPSGSLLGNAPAMDVLFSFTQNTDAPVFPNSLSDLINQLYGSKGGKPSAISALLHGFEFTFGEYEGTVGILPAMELGLSATQTAKTALATAQANTAKIGTLPTTLSALPPFIEIFGMDKNIDLPTDIGGILSLLFSTDGGKPTFYGLANAIMRGYVSSDGTSVPGLRGINDKIGTLPSGSLLGNSPAMDTLFISTQGTNTPVFPVSLSDLINQLYGSTEGPGAISALLHGFDFTLGEYNGPVGVLPAMELGLSANTAAKTAQETANRAKALAESNATAIGTLPDGYETVGAALSAIKGIAEEAKAAALAAIPDPKTEGSNGKYVLTVDIIGDNATYRWEPIDRGNTTTTTE